MVEIKKHHHKKDVLYIYIFFSQWNITQPLKIKNNAICSNMGGPRHSQTE